MAMRPNMYGVVDVRMAYDLLFIHTEQAKLAKISNKPPIRYHIIGHFSDLSREWDKVMNNFISLHSATYV